MRKRHERVSKTRICVQHQGKLESMKKGDLKRMADDESKYMVHGGRLMNPDEIDQNEKQTKLFTS